jgi:hypothetical protein
VEAIMKPKFMPLSPAIGLEIEGNDITKPHNGYQPSNVTCCHDRT